MVVVEAMDVRRIYALYCVPGDQSYKHFVVIKSAILRLICAGLCGIGIRLIWVILRRRRLLVNWFHRLLVLNALSQCVYFIANATRFAHQMVAITRLNGEHEFETTSSHVVSLIFFFEHACRQQCAMGALFLTLNRLAAISLSQQYQQVSFES